VHLDASVAVTIGFAVLSALHYRDRTGKGQFIDLSMGEVLINHLARPALDWVMNNRVDQPIGNVDPDIAPNGCYPCSEPDSWITIVVRTDEQWRSLKQALGNPAWADDQRFDAVAGRVEAREEIDAHLRVWASTMTPYEAFERLQSERVPAGPVYNNDHPLSDPQLVARGFYRWVTHPVTGQYRRPGPLFNLTATPVQFRRHTNLLGEHNHEVLCGLLGLSQAEYEALVEAHVIGEAYDPAYSTDAADKEERPPIAARAGP
jgi:crotonobetainyl-CoA:carnitine CoA-transferase CaiB-like acyl-CoA transferase